MALLNEDSRKMSNAGGVGALTHSAPRVVLCALLILMLIPLFSVPKQAFAVPGVDETLDLSTAASVDELSTYGYEWDEPTLTLTLDGFDMDIPDASLDTIGIILPAGSTIIVEGDSSIIVAADPTALGASGIFCPGDLTIKGEGKLTIEVVGNSNTSTTKYYYTGIGAEGNITIEENTTLDITATNNLGGSSAAGIYSSAAGDITITDGTTVNVTAINNAVGDNYTGSSCAIGIYSATSGNINITAGSQVTCRATNNGSSESQASGLVTDTGDAIISDSTVDFICTTVGASSPPASYNHAYAAQCYGALSISYSDVTFEVTASGDANTNGLYGNNISITGGTIKGTADADSTEGGSICINAEESLAISNAAVVKIIATAWNSAGVQVRSGVPDSFAISEGSHLLATGDAIGLLMISTNDTINPVTIGPGLAILQGGSLFAIDSMESGTPDINFFWTYSETGGLYMNPPAVAPVNSSKIVEIGPAEWLPRTGDTAGGIALICVISGLLLLGAGYALRRKTIKES